MIDELAVWGHVPPLVVGDAEYGDNTTFRLGLTERGLAYVMPVKATTSAYPCDAVPQTPPYSGRGRPPGPRYAGDASNLRDLVLAAGRASLRRVTWRQGTKKTATNPTAKVRSRFIAIRIRPANRDIPKAADGSLPECWLLAEWPPGEPRAHRLSPSSGAPTSSTTWIAWSSTTGRSSPTGFAVRSFPADSSHPRTGGRSGTSVDIPAALYLVTERQLTSWPFDEQGLLIGEEFYRVVLDVRPLTESEYREVPAQPLAKGR